MSEATMTCDWCGKEFPANADACVEAGVDVAEGEQWRVEGLTPEQIAHVKVENGLDDKELAELLETGSVRGLGAIICLECQDAGLDAPEP